MLEGAGGESFTYDDVEVIAARGGTTTMARSASMLRSKRPSARPNMAQSPEGDRIDNYTYGVHGTRCTAVVL